MEIIEDKALVFRTRNPEKYKIIPKHKIIERDDGGYDVAVFWGLDESRVLKNLGVKNIPSPIVRRYDWPGRYKPMAHQVDTASFLTLHRRAFCFNDPGTGKTLASLWAADYLMKLGFVRRVLILCPLSIMQSAWLSDLNNSIIHRSAIVAHHPKASRRIEMIQQDYDFVICNYDGLNLIADEIKNDGRFDLIVVDECFVAGTLVATPQGRRPIEQLEAGEEVLTSNGVKRIKRLVRNHTKRLVRVRTSDGQEITCTPEHPFFTDAGWVTAENLSGRRLVSHPELWSMRQRISSTEAQISVAPCEGYADWLELLTILRTEEVSPVESGSQLFQQHATTPAGLPHETQDRGAPRQTVCSGESQRAETHIPHGERDRNDSWGIVRARTLGAIVGMELPRSVGWEAARLSYELQARLRKPSSQGGFGSGWEQPQSRPTPSTGSQERGEASGAWVESVSYIECPGGEAVYNLEVEGTPNYFVGDGVLVHNCNAYKTATTKRWKTLKSIIGPNTHLWMMTGTPASQSPVDAYGLAKLVNPDGVPHFFTGWRDSVMNKITMYKWAPKHDAKDKVFNALQPAIRYSKDQCLDLPPVITMTREVPLTPQQIKYYNLIKDQMLVQAAGETITAVNAAAMLSKLLQVSAGAALTDTKEVVEFDAAPRLGVLEEILEETPRKVIVFALFRASIETIQNHLTSKGISNDCIHGGVSATKRANIIHRFQTDPDPRVLVMQPAATAHGITLTAADTVVFYGPLMSVEQYIQAIARADRKGQNSDKVTVIHIEGSPVEKKMFKALSAKVSDSTLLTEMFTLELQG